MTKLALFSYITGMSNPFLCMPGLGSALGYAQKVSMLIQTLFTSNIHHYKETRLRLLGVLIYLDFIWIYCCYLITHLLHSFDLTTYINIKTTCNGMYSSLLVMIVLSSVIISSGYRSSEDQVLLWASLICRRDNMQWIADGTFSLFRWSHCCSVANTTGSAVT